MRRSVLFVLALVVASVAVSPAAAASSSSGQERTRRGDIVITSNDQFDAAHGVRSGEGTAADPYVISGWDLFHLEIKDTSKHVVIRNNRINGQLVLDWIGNGVRVHNNYISDLRVNQNVKRTGDMTSGVISNNTFDVVGQLRHWDGVFENNRVGNPSSCLDIPFFLCRGVNFDGFNGAKFRNNEIFGYVEVRLHGHHHASSFGEDSHYHGAEHEGHEGHDGMDHTKRYHRVWVSNNTIHSGDYYGLLYTDTAHSANDRTAASETNPELNNPHEHWTKVYLTNNRIFGAGITVDVFNADDERHIRTHRGTMKIVGNEVHVQKESFQADEAFRYVDGIVIERAKDINLDIARNRVDGRLAGEEPTNVLREEFDYGAGISLYDLDKARVRLTDNVVEHRWYGVRASNMSASVDWVIDGLRTRGVEEDVYYDQSVQNKPRQRD